MKRYLQPVTRPVLVNARTRLGFHHTALPRRLYEARQQLEIASIELGASWDVPRSALSEVVAKTSSMNLTVLPAIDFDSDNLEISPFEEFRIVSNPWTTLTALRSNGFDSAKRFPLFGRIHRLYRTLHRSHTTLRPLPLSCVREIHKHVVGGSTDVCHLPYSHVLKGIFSVGSIRFGLGWSFLWREIKSLSTPFMLQALRQPIHQ